MAATQTAALFCFEDPGSAVGRFAVQAARLLAARGQRVILFTRLPIVADAECVTVQTIGDSDEMDLIGKVRAFTLRASAAFNAAVPEGEAAALVGLEWSSIPALQILGAIRKLHVLLILHTLERQRSDVQASLSKQIEEIETQGMQEAKAVLVHSAATYDAACRLMPDYATKITRLIDAFPITHFQRELDAGAVKARYQIGPVDPTILFCGELNEDHGPDLLIKAVPLILKKYPQARFVFVGDGALFWTLRIYARYLNLDNAVRVVGHLAGDALNELIQAADIVIAPSRKSTENWPILAGWSAGKAVIASNEVAGTLIEHEKNGVLIYPLPDSCAWAVDRIFTDPYLWGRIRENGAAKLHAEFGDAALAAQLSQAIAAL